MRERNCSGAKIQPAYGVRLHDVLHRTDRPQHLDILVPDSQADRHPATIRVSESVQGPSPRQSSLSRNPTSTFCCDGATWEPTGGRAGNVNVACGRPATGSTP